MTLYVPHGCLEEYESAPYWQDFIIMKELEDPDNPDNGDSNSVGTLEDFNDGSKIIYDFTGRNLSNVKDIKELTPGFYIINGKKYLLK